MSFPAEQRHAAVLMFLNDKTMQTRFECGGSEQLQPHDIDTHSRKAAGFFVEQYHYNINSLYDKHEKWDCAVTNTPLKQAVRNPHGAIERGIRLFLPVFFCPNALNDAILVGSM